MKFMITFCHVDGVWQDLSEEQQARHGGWLTDFAAELRREKNSEMVFFNPAGTKRVYQNPDGDKSVLDGEAAGSAESQGGYYIIEAADMAEALDWADRGRFMTGSNEVRQIIDFSPG